MENDEMSEPIKLYRDGEMIETVSPSVAREWQAQGWKLTPDMMPNTAPDKLPESSDVEDVISFWNDDMVNFVEPEPAQPKRKAGRPKKAQ